MMLRDLAIYHLSCSNPLALQLAPLRTSEQCTSTVFSIKVASSSATNDEKNSFHYGFRTLQSMSNGSEWQLNAIPHV